MAVTATISDMVDPANSAAIKAALETLGVASAAVVVIPISATAVRFAKVV